MNTLLEDLRFACRMFLRRPGYAMTLILVLALGIGGTSAVFTIVDGVLLQPLSFQNPDRIAVIIGAERIPQGDSLVWWGQGEAFSLLAEYWSGGVNFSDAGRSERVFATTVSSSFFPLLGIHAQLGRTFSAEDETPELGEVVILSHRFWMRAFGGNKEALGQTIALNGRPYTIVGIMPGGFGYPGHSDLWIPRRGTSIEAIYALDLGSDKQPDLPVGMNWGMLGRIRDGATLAQARMELKRLLELESETFHPGRESREMFIGARPLQELLVREVRTGLLVLLGAVGFLLLVACVNVANLMLVRAAARQKEVAVRLCIGASRGRLVRQMLTESTLVALVGGAGGLVLAFWCVKLVQFLGPKDIPRLADVSLDLRAVSFGLGISLLTGVLVGLAPALQTMGQDLTRAMKGESARSIGMLRKHLRSALVVAEVAMTLVLLAGAGVMIRSLGNLLRTSPGFETQNVVSMEFALPAARYAATKEKTDQDAQSTRLAAFYQQVWDEIGHLPGVLAVGGVDQLPLGGKGGGGLFLQAGKLYRTAYEFDVAGECFRALGISILEGRAFTEQDLRTRADVIVINQAFARAAWPGEDALGKKVRLFNSGPPWPPKEVVGVARNVKFNGLGEVPKPQYYLPMQKLNMTLVVRTASEPGALIAAIRERWKKVDADVPLFNVRTMSEVVADSTTAPRFRGIVLGIFAGMALLLAAFGLYSVVAYSVTNRTHEMGVRMALGAQPGDIVRMVTREGMWLSLVGIAVGGLASVWLNQLIAGLLYGVRPADPVALAVAALLLAAGTLAASLMPALRASRADSAAALRYE